jgi:hypothetical protein
MSRGRGLASFLAGFGTGYLNSRLKAEERKREEERDRREKERHDQQMEMQRRQLDQLDRDRQREEDMLAGLEEAQSMRVGEGLRDATGAAIDTSAEAMEQRLVESGADPEVAAQTAPIYAERAGAKGAEGWLSGSMGMGKVRPTTQADIIRAKGAALTKGGAKYLPQVMDLQERADKLDLEELQAKILSANSIEEIDREYDIIPDGYRARSAIGEDGRFRYWYEDDQGNRVEPKVGPKDFADFNEFKQFAAAYVKANPEYITSTWESARKRKTESEDRAHSRDRERKEDEFKERDYNLRKQGQDANIKIAQAGLTLRRKELERGGEAPAEVRTAQWLIKSGVANDEKEAWEMVKTTKSSSPQEAIQDITVRLMKDNPDYQENPEQAATAARRIYQSIVNPNAAVAPPANRPPLDSFNG